MPAGQLSPSSLSAEESFPLPSHHTRPRAADSSRISLAEYLELVRAVPEPTPAQMEAFAYFVTQHHSWYKGPMLPPGMPVHFAVLPEPWDAEAAPSAFGRLNGHLAYGFCSRGSLAYTTTRGSARRVIANPLRVRNRDGVPCLLPEEVVTEGEAWMSGLAHVRGVEWLPHHLEPLRRAHWPDASGGEAQLRKIVARCEEIHADESAVVFLEPYEGETDDAHNKCTVDYPLYLLTEPERARQRGEMAAAMTRLARLIWR